MMNMENDIVRLSSTDTAILYNRLHQRAEDAYIPTLRICTGEDSRGRWVKYDLGNTGWTPPLYHQEF